MPQRKAAKEKRARAGWLNRLTKPKLWGGDLQVVKRFENDLCPKKSEGCKEQWQVGQEVQEHNRESWENERFRFRTRLKYKRQEVTHRPQERELTAGVSHVVEAIDEWPASASCNTFFSVAKDCGQ